MHTSELKIDLDPTYKELNFFHVSVPQTGAGPAHTRLQAVTARRQGSRSATRTAAALTQRGATAASTPPHGAPPHCCPPGLKYCLVRPQRLFIQDPLTDQLFALNLIRGSVNTPQQVWERAPCSR